MNCPSRTDEPAKGDGYNQSPNELSNDLTTNQDLNGIANSRVRRRAEPPPIEAAGSAQKVVAGDGTSARNKGSGIFATVASEATADGGNPTPDDGDGRSGSGNPGAGGSAPARLVKKAAGSVWQYLRTYAKHIGPGFMIAVAYSI
jgi:metal iron transporter